MRLPWQRAPPLPESKQAMCVNSSSDTLSAVCSQTLFGVFGLLTCFVYVVFLGPLTSRCTDFWQRVQRAFIVYDWLGDPSVLQTILSPSPLCFQAVTENTQHFKERLYELMFVRWRRDYHRMGGCIQVWGGQAGIAYIGPAGLFGAVMSSCNHCWTSEQRAINEAHRKTEDILLGFLIWAGSRLALESSPLLLTSSHHTAQVDTSKPIPAMKSISQLVVSRRARRQLAAAAGPDDGAWYRSAAQAVR